MIYITFPDAPEWRGVYAAKRYRGNAASAAELSVLRVRMVDRGNAMVHHHQADPIEIGTAFVQRMHSYNSETNEFDGVPESWQRIPPDVYKGGVICAVSRDLSSSPGSPMKDPLGTPIFVDDDGDNITEGRPSQPIGGAQARDQWTGALQFEEDGTTPVLVPAP